MIRYYDPSMEEDFCRVLDADPVYGGRIYTLLCCYGNDCSFCDLWLITRGEQPVGAISLYSSVVTLVTAPPGPDYGELADFLKVIGWQQVEGMVDAVRELAGYFPGYHRFSSQVVTYSRSLPPGEWGPVPSSQPAYSAIYGLLCQCFEDFAQDLPYEPWVCDLSCRCRRGLAAVALVRQGEEPVSTAGIYYSAPGSTVVGGVATRPDCRGKGYARQAIYACVRLLQEQGKTPYLITAHNGLVPFYTRMGFSPYGVRMTLNRPVSR